MALLLLFLSSLFVLYVKCSSDVWYCINLQTTQLSAGVKWVTGDVSKQILRRFENILVKTFYQITENCTNDASQPPLLTVNSVSVDLTDPSVRVVPAGLVFIF